MAAKKSTSSTTTTKSKAKETTDTTTPVTTTPVTTTPVTTTSTKKKSTKESTVTKPVETMPVVATTDTKSEMENVVVVSDLGETSITENFSEFITKFQSMITSFSTLKQELKVLERRTIKQLKVVQKMSGKKRAKGTRAPSGFVKPAPISDELAKFLGKPSGSEMARTDVTKEINKYIRANNLQDKANGRQINPDESLQQLLKIDKDITLTYFNLQRYMGPHFPKQVKTEATTDA